MFHSNQEFLGGVFDAERSATSSGGNNISAIGLNDGSDLESSPPKKRISVSPLTEVWNLGAFGQVPNIGYFSLFVFLFIWSVQNHVSARRTSEESARLVAAAIKRGAASGTQSSSNGCHEGDNRRVSHPAGDSFKSPPLPSPRNTSSGRSFPNSNLDSDVSFTLSTSRVRQRKFPGPAGLLPERDRSHIQVLFFWLWKPMWWSTCCSF